MADKKKKASTGAEQRQVASYPGTPGKTVSSNPGTAAPPNGGIQQQPKQAASYPGTPTPPGGGIQQQKQVSSNPGTPTSPNGGIRQGQREAASYPGTPASPGGGISPNVTAAQDYLTKAANNGKPTYSSPYDQQVADAYNKLLGREAYSYDANADAMYQQYKDLYMQNGKQAMIDTMGQAAMLTGGYGNSYASAAGNQAYQQYLTQLNEKLPEFEQRAYERYRDQRQDLQNQYEMAAGMADRDYGRYRDELSDWYNDRDYAEDQRRYDQEWAEDLRRYQDETDRYNAEQEENRRRYDQEWDEDLRRYQDETDRYNAEQEENRRRYDQEWNEDQRRYQDETDRYNAEQEENRRRYDQEWNRDAEQWQWQQETDQRDFDYRQQSEQQEYAYNTAIAMLNKGQMPTLELLTNAGISEEDARRMLAMYTGSTGSGGGGSSGGSKGTAGTTGTTGTGKVRGGVPGSGRPQTTGDLSPEKLKGGELDDDSLVTMIMDSADKFQSDPATQQQGGLYNRIVNEIRSSPDLTTDEKSRAISMAVSVLSTGGKRR